MLSIKRSQVAGVVETVEGVKEPIAAADAFLAGNVKFTPGLKMHERNGITGSLSKAANIPGERQATMTFDVELGGAAGAGIAPFWGKLFRCCRYLETVVASTSVTYTPGAAPGPTMTLAWYEDGKVYRLWGARGTWQLRANEGEPGVISFTFTGADWEVADEPLLTGVSYEPTLPPAFMGASFLLDGYSAKIAALTIDAANTVTLRKDISSPSGFKSAMVTDRKPTVKVDPEDVLAADKDFFATWRSGAQVTMSAIIGSTAGNTITISAPKVQYQEIALSDRDSLGVTDITGLLCINSGDDELSIAVT